MVKDGVALPNTHDSFILVVFYKGHLGMHENNDLIPSAKKWYNHYAALLVTENSTDLSIEMLLLWIPVYVAGLVCVPLVLIGRLYGSHAWGFLAACWLG